MRSHAPTTDGEGKKVTASPGKAHIEGPTETGVTPQPVPAVPNAPGADIGVACTSEDQSRDSDTDSDSSNGAAQTGQAGVTEAAALNEANKNEGAMLGMSRVGDASGAMAGVGCGLLADGRGSRGDVDAAP